MNRPESLSKDEKFDRRSIRLAHYDYRQPGAYFITLCTYRRKCLFGQIEKWEMGLNDYGQIVQAEWQKTAHMRGNLTMDECIVMPNHVHGIIVINPSRGTMHRAPTPLIEQFGKPVSNSIPTIIRGFKSAVTTRIRKLVRNPNFIVWQRNYYEHIIRNEIDLEETREYIQMNPLKWPDDENHPANVEKRNRLGRMSTRFVNSLVNE